MRRGAGPSQSLALFLASVGGCSADTLELSTLTEVTGRDAGAALDAVAVVPDDTGVFDRGPRLDRLPVTREPVLLNTGDELFSYDSARGAARFLAAFSEGGAPLNRPMIDIAVDGSGRLFGGTEGAVARGLIWAIDPDSGEAWRLFNLDDIPIGLTFDGEGRLVVAGAWVSFYDVDSGERLQRFAVGEGFQTSGDIVGLPNGLLYWTVLPSELGPDGDGLIELHPRTGSTRFLARLGRERIFGLGYADGSLFGFGFAGFALSIDPSSGRVLGDAATPGGRWYGATANPVVW